MAWQPRAGGIHADQPVRRWELRVSSAALHPTGSEFYYVLSGTGEFTVDAEVIQGGPSLAVYLPPGTRHSVRAAERLRVLYGFSPPDRARVGHVWEE